MAAAPHDDAATRPDVARPAARPESNPADGIGEWVAAMRHVSGIKVSELARLVGVSPSLISQIERGQSAPSVSTLFQLAQALKVSVDALFSRSPVESSMDAVSDIADHGAAEQGNNGATPSRLRASGATSSDGTRGRSTSRVACAGSG